MLKYKNITLRPICAEDIADYVHWITVETEWRNWDAPWRIIDPKSLVLTSHPLASGAKDTAKMPLCFLWLIFSRTSPRIYYTCIHGPAISQWSPLPLKLDSRRVNELKITM